MEMDQEEDTSEKDLRPAGPSSAFSILPDDLTVEILSRLPVRFLHRCKCVSKSWRDLIAHPSHRKTMPQTLAGFFYGDYSRYADVSGAAHPAVDPSFPFLPTKFRDGNLTVLDCCSGLVLCRCFTTPSRDEFHYIVCNPATERWVELGKRAWQEITHIARLAFDPAASPHFHIFEFERNLRGPLPGIATGVHIYSSRSRAWNYIKSGWGQDIALIPTPAVFVDGMLHLVTYWFKLAAVDTEGKVWKDVLLPGDACRSCIGLWEGRLLCVDLHCEEQALWCLEDYDSSKWAPGPCISSVELVLQGIYNVTAVHPHRGIVFFVPREFGDTTKKLASYDLRHMKVRRLLDLGKDARKPFLPYVPLFSDSLADVDGH